MAKREYSNGLQHLKFMQRAKQREEAIKKVEEEEAAVADESHWVVPVSMQASGRRCTIIVEGDPKPGALLGRMSFQNCNASVDKLVEESEAIYKRRFSAAKEKAEAAFAAGTTELSRCEPRKEEDRGALTTEDEESVQFKKPKVEATNNLSAGVGGTERQSPGRGNSNTWQGWRGPGDYRMLRPSPK